MFAQRLWCLVLAALVSFSVASGQRPRDEEESSANLERLRGQDVSQRVAAARRISQRAGVGPEYAKGVPALVEMLQFNGETAKQPAAETLAHIASVGTENESRVPQLKMAIGPLAAIVSGDEPEETRRWAVIAITDVAVHLGPEAIAPVVPLLAKSASDPSSDVSRWSVQGLGEFGPAAKSAVPALVAQLGNREIQSTVIESLGRIQAQPEVCVPALMNLLSKPIPAEERTRREQKFPIESDVARALGQFESDAKDAVPALTKLLAADNFVTVEASAFALGKIGHATPAVIDALEQAFVDAGEEMTYTHLGVFGALCDLGPEGKTRAGKLAEGFDGFKIEGVGHLINSAQNVMEVLASVPNMKALDLSGSGLRTDELARLSEMKQLEYLILPEISDQSLRHVSGLTNLVTLLARSRYDPKREEQNVTDKGLEHLSQLTKLQSLSMGTEITGDGLKHLRAMESLGSLTLGGITDQALQHLPPLPALETLDLSGRGITDAALGPISRCKRLTSLGLGGTGVSDAGITVLAKNLPHLERLGLSFTRVTADCVDDLAKLKQLEELSVLETPLGNSAAVVTLEERLPNCRIQFLD